MRMGEMKMRCPESFLQSSGQSTPEDFSFLFDNVKAMFELQTGSDIYDFAAESLRKFIGNCIVLVSSYDKTKDTLSLRAVAGLGNHMDKVIGLFGSHSLIGLSFPLNQEAHTGLRAARLTKLNGIYELAMKSLPEGLCSRLEDILGIRCVGCMGITWCEYFMGSVAILRGSGEMKNSKIIETFIDYAAIRLYQLATAPADAAV